LRSMIAAILPHGTGLRYYILDAHLVGLVQFKRRSQRADRAGITQSSIE
jgi:hypothetical protein